MGSGLRAAGLGGRGSYTWPQTHSGGCVSSRFRVSQLTAPLGGHRRGALGSRWRPRGPVLGQRRCSRRHTRGDRRDGTRTAEPPPHVGREETLLATGARLLVPKTVGPRPAGPLGQEKPGPPGGAWEPLVLQKRPLAGAKSAHPEASLQGPRAVWSGCSQEPKGSWGQPGAGPLMSRPESPSRGRREGPRLRLLWAVATTWHGGTVPSPWSRGAAPHGHPPRRLPEDAHCEPCG